MTSFCARHTRGLAELEQATRRFTPELVAAAAISPPTRFARPRACSAPAPGLGRHRHRPRNGPPPTCCNTWYRRSTPSAGATTARANACPTRACSRRRHRAGLQATSPQPQWLRDGTRSRVSPDIGELFVLSPYGPQGEMPTAAIADGCCCPAMAR